MYTNEMPVSLLEYVKRNRNCEDIAMSFMVANVTNGPPIWAKGKIYEIGSTGISSLGGHSNKRTECVNRFVSEFGRMPLLCKRKYNTKMESLNLYILNFEWINNFCIQKNKH
ncbi:hypothetical protein L1987_35297 [Smallanthus sonchifolius]|uniref:Uncharacterized protein n=1 Tax=Smallanthus sonchifolius TaxID=185202 RepID=A0ACB9HXP7_9ASTR|nr:hypothetical protein L1987_35297 [Smallanthus sonchifolius]